MQESANISVIIPAYNHIDFLTRSVNSVLSQTKQPSEIILINDGRVEFPVKEALRSVPRIKCHVEKPNPGVSSTYNTGIELANSDWVAFLDGDDAWHPKKLEHQLRLMEPDVGFIFCNKAFITEESEVPFAFELYEQDFAERPLINLLKCFFGSPSTALIRREIFELVGKFKEELMSSMDYDLWIRIAGQTDYRFALCPKILTYKRKHRRSITSIQSPVDWINDLIGAIENNKHLFLSRLGITEGEFSVHIGRSYGYMARKFAVEKDYEAMIYCLKSAYSRDLYTGVHATRRFFWKYTRSSYYPD